MMTYKQFHLDWYLVYMRMHDLVLFLMSALAGSVVWGSESISILVLTGATNYLAHSTVKGRIGGAL
jgi:hypothetical protein